MGNPNHTLPRVECRHSLTVCPDCGEHKLMNQTRDDPKFVTMTLKYYKECQWCGAEFWNYGDDQIGENLRELEQ